MKEMVREIVRNTELCMPKSNLSQRRSKMSLISDQTEAMNDDEGN